MLHLDQFFETRVSPPSMDNRFIRVANNDLPELIKFDIPPTNRLSEYNQENNQIQFSISSANLLDPYSLYLDLDVKNTNNNAIQLDHSAHSIIADIAVYANVNIFFF